MSVDWPDCLNVRDLGGLPAGSGRIAAGALIRSDNLTRLTAAGIDAVRAARLGRIVDVRSPAECEHYPSPFAGDPLHCNRPVGRPDDPWDSALSLGQNYVVGLDRNSDLYAAAVDAVATAPPGGVLVHCHSGKDRTGMIVAFALSLAGVPAETIVADYAAVSDRMRAHFTELLTAVEEPVERGQLAEEFSSRPETMVAALDHLEFEYGGVEAYLRRGGLGGAAIDRLRDRLIDPAG
ncbi:MAG TPA: tyrosine-protein phosphatase [Mycobacteriales bacterium]|nr:tyrosine-protein phosphatase [Mycobacteriales bacterium]